MQAEGGAPLTGAHAPQPVPVEPPRPDQPVVDPGSVPAGSTSPASSPASSGPGSAAATDLRRLGLVLAVAALVLLLDQLTKAYVVSRLAGRPPLELLGGWLTLTYTRNPGAAFSIGTGTTWIFTAVAVTVVVVILRTARRLRSTVWAVALGVLLGGALGNLGDRLFRAPGFARGHVVDWIELPHYPVFNIADSAIVCAAVAMVLLTLLGRDMDGSNRRHPAPGADVADG